MEQTRKQTSMNQPEHPKGPKYLYSRMSGFYIISGIDLGKYPP